VIRRRHHNELWFQLQPCIVLNIAVPPMPRVYNPSPPEAGPRSIFAATNMAKKCSRRRRKARSHSPQRSPKVDEEQDENTSKEQQQFIGQELLDWHDDVESVPGNTAVPSVSMRDTAGSLGDGTVPVDIEKDTLQSRRAVAVDTRYLDTTEGIHVGTNVLKQCEKFLRSLVVRGVTPCLLASTVPASTKPPLTSSKKGAGLRIRTIALDTEQALKKLADGSMFSLATLDVAATASKEDELGKAVQVPTELLAKSSWKVLSELGK
jgi:hypothetical protein